MKIKHGMMALIFVLAIALFGVALTGSAQEFGSNWTGQYWNNTNFSGDPVITTVDNAINFNWGTASPIPGFINPDNFSVRWTGTHQFQAGVYQFSAGRDDSVRVFVDGTLIIDAFGGGPFQTFTAQVTLSQGSHTVVVEYVEITDEAAVQVQWSLASAAGPTPTQGPTATPRPTALPPIPPGAITATVIRAAVLNVRDAPSLGGNIVGRVLRGQTYQIVGRDPHARWFLIQLHDRQGWVWGYYVFVDGNEFTPPIASATTLVLPGGLTDTGVMAQSQAVVKLRAQPTVNSMQTGRITWGGFVPVLGRTANGVWWQVLWKGTIGWTYAPFYDIVFGDLNSVPIVTP